MNKKILLSILIVIALALAGNLAYRSTQILKNPVFLTHYYERHIREERTTFELFYITNAMDHGYIKAVSFPELSETISESTQIMETYTQSLLNDYKVEVLKVSLALPSDSDYMLTKADLLYSDGESTPRHISVDFGTIALWHLDTPTPDVVTNVDSYDTSNGMSCTTYKAQETVTYAGHKLPLDSSVLAFFSIKLPQEGSTLQAGESLSIESSFGVPKEKPEYCHVYLFDQELYFVTADGRKQTVLLNNSNHFPTFDTQTVRAILKEAVK